jgi:hypothetical protein
MQKSFNLKKKQLPKVYTGSLMQNFWGFIIKAEIFVNPKDPYGMKFYQEFNNRVTGKNKQKNFHPNFEYSSKIINGVDNHTYVQYTWLNNSTHKFYFHYSKLAINDMYSGMKVLNEICDAQRQYEGFDDEPEDEERSLF